MVIKKPGTALTTLAFLGAFFVVAVTAVRAEGIAVSTDGLLWTKGAGSYGKGWNHTGRSVSVRQGETIYIKFYSATPGVVLHCTEHGRRWGGWRTMGPVLTDEITASHDLPIILRISKAGTPESTVTWLNGRDASGTWRGLPAPGPYDLALHDGAKWTLPPIVVTQDTKPPGFWAALLKWLNPPAEAPDDAVAVPDLGLSAGLLALSLTLLIAAQRRRGV